jgi:colanic acid/amylovoran biosynthesis protein
MYGIADDSQLCILIVPGDYVLRNAGDIAMLKTAVSRLRRMWPKASIQILGDESNVRPGLCYDARPMGIAGHRLWFGPFLLPSILRDESRSWVRKLENHLRRRYPSRVESIFRARFRQHPPVIQALDEFLGAVATADLVIVSGMGGITDAFPEFAENLLDMLHLALHYRRLTVLMSQGIGPLENPGLIARARAVLPRVELIALREELAGGALLNLLGVDRRRTLTTGDDAIEMAYESRSPTLGSGIGINLRAASYAGVNQELVEQVGRILREVARKYSTRLVALPISWVPGEEDSVTIGTLLADNPALVDSTRRIGSVSEVLEQVRRCRIVVTGSYHAAVFSLSQGIPAVGIANSQYYLDKFRGLSNQFGGYCEVVDIAATDSLIHLRAAIERVWETAVDRRPMLLAAARRQIGLSRAAYKKVHELVVSRKELDADAERT